VRRLKEHPLTQHVGNPNGRIAIWCAVARAYPQEDDE
jgi:hypothetical protein